jgi:hypothetical protein
MTNNSKSPSPDEYIRRCHTSRPTKLYVALTGLENLSDFLPRAAALG